MIVASMSENVAKNEALQLKQSRELQKLQGEQLREQKRKERDLKIK